MRILHTSELYAPSVGGAQEVVRQISERLARRGHEVTVATTRLPGRPATVIGGVRIAEFSISGNPVRGYSGETSQYQRFLRTGNFDVMLNYAAQQWTADLAYDVLDELPYVKILAPCGFSGLRSRAYAAYFARLPEVLRRYDQLVFHSLRYQDAAFAREHGLSHQTVIPNGAAEEEFESIEPGFRARYGIPEEASLLLTVGTHTGLKGHRLAIEAFVKARIGPAVLAIIGNRPHGIGCWPACKVRSAWTSAVTHGAKRVLMLDVPRDQVLSAFASADLFIFGSSVECAPLVLYEAMASGTPFVSVSCGNAEEIAEHGGGIIVPSQMLANGRITADPGTVARYIEDLLANKQRREIMAQAGRSAWRSLHRWEHITSQYESLYEKLLTTSRAKALRSTP